MLINIFLLILLLFVFNLTKRLRIKCDNLKREVKKYKKENLYDDLTSLGNKRKLLRDLNRLYYDFKRYRHRFSAIMIDLDKFKQINDKYGHSEGDKELQYFSEVLRKCVRKSDRVYRMSGDEFVILLPHSNSRTTKNVIKRIISSSNINISYGICPAKEPDLLLKEIDKRMYEDKKRK